MAVSFRPRSKAPCVVAFHAAVAHGSFHEPIVLSAVLEERAMCGIVLPVLESVPPEPFSSPMSDHAGLA